MTRFGLILGAAALGALGTAAVAQQGGYGGAPSGQPNYGTTPSRDIPAQTPRRSSKAKEPEKPSKDQVLKEARDIGASVQLACNVTDANLLGEGKAQVNGQMLDTKNIEVSCDNGMGYLLTSSPPQKASGYSCFAAEHAAKKSTTPQGSPTCSLNADTKAMAGTVLGKLGKQCQPTGVAWIGVNSGNEYTEVACTGGTGYVLTSAMPGQSTAPLAAMTCVDAAKQGIGCKMSYSGPPPITLDTFKAELAKHNVACNSTNLRSIGKETEKKRYLVEFQCPAEHPKGLVAVIPLQDSTAPFETIDCAQAAARYKVICTYVRQ